MKLFYDLWYRFGKVPWEIGPREELVGLVESGRISPCKTIDLGCGTGDNAIFLAQHGFEVTAIDYAPSAIAKAKAVSKESPTHCQVAREPSRSAPAVQSWPTTRMTSPVANPVSQASGTDKCR